MASSQENRNFIESIFGTEYVLDQVIEWINSNLEPDDVFDDSKLSKWAIDYGFTDEKEEDDD